MFYDNLKLVCDSKGLKITPIVAECGGAKGSITNWKNGATPNSDIVIRLATRLEVTTDFLLLGSDKCTCSEEQEELLSHFNNLSPIDKGKVIERAETLAELAAERAAKERAAEQAKKTAKPVELAADEQPEPNEPEDDRSDEDNEDFYIDLCSLPASAGTGVQLDEGYTEPMQIVRTKLAERANYAVRVSGDSMEDTYYDGDIVLIETCPNIDVGEIGLFVVNDQGYIKQRGEDRLISLNPERDDVYIHDGDYVSCRGRVLGIAEIIK